MASLGALIGPAITAGGGMSAIGGGIQAGGQIYQGIAGKQAADAPHVGVAIATDAIIRRPRRLP